MKIALSAILILLGCNVAPEQTWHDRFIEDSCNRCPMCCTSTANTNAWVADGAVCTEENFDKVLSGEMNKEQLEEWCTSINKDSE